MTITINPVRAWFVLKSERYSLQYLQKQMGFAGDSGFSKGSKSLRPDGTQIVRKCTRWEIVGEAQEIDAMTATATVAGVVNRVRPYTETLERLPNEIVRTLEVSLSGEVGPEAVGLVLEDDTIKWLAQIKGEVDVEVLV